MKKKSVQVDLKLYCSDNMNSEYRLKKGILMLPCYIGHPVPALFYVS